MCALAATCKATKDTNLSVNIFRDNSATGDNDLKQLKSVETSHVSEYLGTGGLILKTAFTNLITHGCEPIVI